MAEKEKKNQVTNNSKKNSGAKKSNTTSAAKKTTKNTTKKVGTTVKKTTSKTTRVNEKVEPKKEGKTSKVLYIEKNVVPTSSSLNSKKETTKSGVLPKEVNSKKELREIPLSNYIIVGIIIVWILIFMYIGYKMTQNYREKLYDEGYFIHEKINIKKTHLSEVKRVISESSSSLFLFFNYRGIEETYDLEKEIYQIMKDYHISENFYYIDLTSNYNEEAFIEEMKETLEVPTLLNVPAIFYYQDGKLVTIAQREDQKVLEAADFVKVLDMYEFKK